MNTPSIKQPYSVDFEHLVSSSKITVHFIYGKNATEAIANAKNLLKHEEEWRDVGVNKEKE